MKKFTLLFLAILFNRFVFAVCDTTAHVTITTTDSITCLGSTTYICAPSGYINYAWSPYNYNYNSPCNAVHASYGSSTSTTYYSVTVTDSNGCVITSNVIPEIISPGPSANFVSVGDTFKSISVDYNSRLVGYQWFLNDNPIAGATNATLVDMDSGTYYLRATDSLGCSANSQTRETVSTSLSVSLGPNRPQCRGRYIQMGCTVNGGFPPYTYNWATTDTLPYDFINTHANGTAATMSQLGPVTYYLTVTDYYGTSAVASVTYNVLDYNSGGVLSYTVSESNCQAYDDSVILTITGGSPPFYIDWNDIYGNNPDTADYSPATHVYYWTGQEYQITIADMNGCLDASFQDLYVGLQLSFPVTTTAYCGGPTGGSLYLAALGGTPPYDFLWSNGATTNDSLTGVSPGSYGLTVTDAMGCSLTSSGYTISAPDTGFYVYVAAAPVDCNTKGNATALPSGGSGNYRYQWSNFSYSPGILGLNAGTYSVSVTDQSNGCLMIGYAHVDSVCVGIISGTVFYDLNGNCIFDSSDFDAPGIYVQATGDSGSYYSTVNYTGKYFIAVPYAGNYTLSLGSNAGNDGCANIVLCDSSGLNAAINGLGDSSNNHNFAIETGGSYDLTMHPGWQSASPGFIKRYWIFPYNQTSVPFNSTATVVFTYDPNLIYDSSIAPFPLVDTVAHTLTWAVNNIPSPDFSWSTVRLECYFYVPASLSPTYLLQSDFKITPTIGDCDSSNNDMHFSDPCGGSHDPNEKIVSPAGQLSEADSILTYTIYFQNTGNWHTYFITLYDTLDPSLDPTTVRTIASSDKYSDFSLTGKGILKWTFNPLFLPDSASDPDHSKGFVIFTVKRKANLANQTPISNKASIYFDYNQPVVTNTVTDTFSTGTVLSIFKTDRAIAVDAFPNPFNKTTTIAVTGLTDKYDFELFDITGKLVKKISSIRAFQFQLNRDELASGVYMFRITSDGQSVYKKLIVQ